MVRPSRVLVTGFPALRARFVVEAVAQREPESTLLALVHPERLTEAEEARAALPVGLAARLELVAGDPAAMDFGFSGKDYLALVERVDVVHAAYSITDPAVSAEVCERVNVGAARELVELGRARSRPLPVVFYSSVFVSGGRSGRVLEGDLEAGQSFRSAAERTLAIAERILRRGDMPLLVLRSGHLLGDRMSGAMDHLSGPYALVVLIASAPEDGPISLPPGSDAPLPLTAVDRLAELGAFAAGAGAFGRTIHALDFGSVTLREFLELCAERCGKRIEPGFHPTAFTRLLLGNPAARLLQQRARGILDVLTTSAEYDTRELLELTASGAPHAAALDAYVTPLVDHVRARIQDGTLVPTRHSFAPWLVA
ncbi:MAG TPA: SDR family oxidoreductase [Polyangiaceae bacterium]